MKIQTGAKLLFQGDSVTDAGRTRPISEGLHNPLGGGYPNLVNGLLTAVYPERMIPAPCSPAGKPTRWTSSPTGSPS